MGVEFTQGGKKKKKKKPFYWTYAIVEERNREMHAQADVGNGNIYPSNNNDTIIA